MKAETERRQRLRSYGGRHESRAEVVEPASVRELRELLVGAARRGRSVTIRGGGQSIDDRALGEDLVLSTRGLDAIEVNAVRAEVTVGPGATWGAILRRLPRGLVPHVVVTTSAATAGGTLSSDCVSRFSPCFGRESRHVASFELMTVDGRILTCTRDGENRAVFAAVTAGLGYVGVLIRITYRLLDLRALFAGRPAHHDLRVATHVRRHADFDSLLADLLERSPSSAEPEAVYAVASMDGAGAVHRSRYVVTGRPLRPIPVARRPTLLRLALEYLMWSQPMGRAMWRVILDGYYRFRTDFLDELFGFTFCMDGNARAVSLVRRFGIRVHFVQQTFVIPGSPQEPGASAARSSGFMREAARQLRARGISPTLLDVLYLPPEPGSSGGGLAITLAFITTERARVAALSDCMVDLSTLCRSLKGHVHLVKDILARSEDLAAMHNGRLAELFAVRARLDPESVLRNDFFERLLSPLRPAATAPGGISKSPTRRPP